MANTTTTTIASVINTEEIVAYIQAASHANSAMSLLAHRQDVVNSASASFPKVTALSAPVAGDQGTTAITPQAFTLTDAVATAAPYELAVNVSKQAFRLMSPSAKMAMVDEIVYQLANKVEVAGCTLLGSLDAGVGSSGVNITSDVMNAAAVAHYVAHPARAAQSVFALHPQQIGDLMAEPISATLGLGQMMSNDRFINLFGTNPGSTVLGTNAGSWGGVPVLRLANVQTANAGADRAGGLFCYGEGGAFGLAVLWEPEIEESSLAPAYMSGRTFLGDVSFGWIEIDGTKGQKIVTDA